MSRWKEEFEAHPIHETLKQSREWLNTEAKDIDGEHAIEKRRLIKVLNKFKAAIGSVDKEAAPIALLNQVNNHLQQQQFWRQLSAYSQTPNSNPLVSANNHINGIIPVIQQIAATPRSASKADSEDSKERILDEFTKVISAKEAKISEEIEGQKEQIKRLIDQKEALEGEMKELSRAHYESLNEWQTEFTDHQISRTEKYSDADIARNKAFEDLLVTIGKTAKDTTDQTSKRWEKTLTAFFTKFQNDIENKRTDAKNKHNSILEMHGLVAEDSVAGGYNKLARDECKHANSWRRISFAFISATILWIGFTYLAGYNVFERWFSAPETLSWVHLLKSASLTAVLLYGAIYASKQSNLHRNNEKKTRWFALEVKAINPFISSLTAEQKRVLIEKFSEKLFGQNAHQEPSGATEFSPNMLKAVGEMVAQISKSTKK